MAARSFSFIMTKPVFIAAASCLSLLLLAACTPAAPPQAPVRAVKVMTVGASSLEATTDYAGEVRARIESRLGFRVGGKITRRQAEIGQRVSSGQVLAQLDPADYRLGADAARAQVAVALTNRDLAAADFKRYETLKAQNFISGAELERRDATRKAAEAQLSQANAQFAVQGNQAQYTALLADAPGVVTAVEAEPGQVVTAAMTVVRVAVDGVRDVVFAVPEDRVAAIVPGAPVLLRPWNQTLPLASTAPIPTATTDPAATSTLSKNNGVPLLRGRVREVAASSDPVTRTYTVKVAVDGNVALPLGSTVMVQPNPAGLAAPRVIKLPTTALWRDGPATAVWVVDAASMTVKPQRVEIATADGNDAVVAAGLQPGMVVVTAGVHVLAPGQKVSIYKPAASAPLK